VTISEAVEQGISRIRKPHWAFPDDVLILSVEWSERLQRHLYGPWGELHSPQMASIEGMRHLEKQMVLVLGDPADDWVAAP